MKTKILWYSILLLFFLGFLGFAVGFYNALSIGIAVTQPLEPSGTTSPETAFEGAVNSENVEKPPDEGLHIVALGDSLARGTGDLEQGGLAARVAEGLQERVDEPVNLYNFAVEGMRSGDLVDQLEDPMTLTAVGNAGYLLVSIGGNDLRAVARLPLLQQEQAFEESLRAHLTSLSQAIQKLRSVNEEAPILFIGLYQPDRNSPNDRESAYLAEWNFETQRLLATDLKAQLIPTYDLFQFNLNRFLSPDGLHPSAAGHGAIAERVLQNLP